MNSIGIINIISIILAIIGIIIVLFNNNKYCDNNKNNFYGGPPGRQRALTTKEFGYNRGWESFKCSNDEPNCDLIGHRGSTASALLHSIEFDPN